MTDKSQCIILDGGLGHYLKQRGVADLITGLPFEQQFLSGAIANLQRPDLITEAHLAFIHAGAQVITTNTFALTPWSLARINQQHNLEALVKAAAVAAQKAVELASPQHTCRIAGSLPPLEECYQANPMTDMQLQQGYAHLASLLAPHVDVLCCETLASVREGAIAVRAAATTGKPVWVAWTLRDDCTATLRSGEPLQAALDAVAGVEGLDAVLVNCCAPQSVTAAVPTLAAWAAKHGVRCGAYANGFSTTTSQWLASQALQGSEEGAVTPVELVPSEYDAQGVVLPTAYAAHAAQWVALGATMSRMANLLHGTFPRLWAAYNRSLTKHPIHTKAATSCVAFALGDVLAQHLTNDHQGFDFARTLRMASFGAIIAGPVGHHWYRFLDTNIGVRNPTAPGVIATKVGLDQFLFAPLSTFMFYAYLVSAEGRPSAYMATIRDKYWATNIASWKLWPAAHVLNFLLVPPPHRILYANVVSILGTYILSRVANKQGQHAELTMDGAAIH